MQTIQRASRLLFFLPAVWFALLWLHVVNSGLAIEEAMKHDISTPQFIAPMNRAMDDPWLHNSALRRYFQKLQRSSVAPAIWSSSEWLAYALWSQYQFAGGIEIMMVIAHNQNMPQKELIWTKRYTAIFPNTRQGRGWMAHATAGHNRGEPLRITGRW
ncbi:MAG: hypothetical protein Q9M13_01405 [Mariprofundales bacterium]|nr:hypothetical protein [Mariprofundales bacterium]